jgi:putative peptidoglycan lipid II flippase
VSEEADLPRRSLAGSTLVMAAGTMTSRILGFIRTALLTAAIAVMGDTAEAFDSANRLPDFFYAVVAGGVLNAILVPQIVRAYQGSDAERFVNRLLTMGIALLGGLTVALTLAAPALIAVYTVNWSESKRGLAVAFAFWCLPQLFFFGLYTLLGQLLNARGSFGPYMWAPAVNNVVQIVALSAFIVAFGSHHPLGSWTAVQIALLAGGTTAGVACQALVLFVPLRRIGFRFRPQFSWRGSGLGPAFRVASWTLAALALDQVAVWVAYRTASSAAAEGAAANSVLTHALTLYVIPHSIITVSLTTALFTQMSAAAGRNDLPGVRASLSLGMRTIAAFMAFFTAALIVLALPLARVVLPATADLDGIAEVSRAVVPLALGLIPLGITLLIKRVFFAFEDGQTVFAFQIPMSALFILGCLVSTRILPPDWWVIGIGASQTLSYLAGAVLRLGTLRDRLMGVDGPRVAWTMARTALAAAVAGELGWLALSLFPGIGVSVGWSALALVTVGLGMASAYVALCRAMRVGEVEDFLRPLLAARSRRAGGATR